MHTPPHLVLGIDVLCDSSRMAVAQRAVLSLEIHVGVAASSPWGRRREAASLDVYRYKDEGLLVEAAGTVTFARRATRRVARKCILIV